MSSNAPKDGGEVAPRQRRSRGARATHHAIRPVDRSPLYEQIIDRLREMITAAGLKPGDRLMSERELAARLGVSRTSVRQAFAALQEIGLVHVRHGDGVFLAKDPDAVLPSLASELEQRYGELPAIIEVREAIEAQTARLAARRRTDGDLDAMRSALDDMRRAEGEGRDPAEGDAAFHASIVAAARNPLLTTLWEQIGDWVDQTRRASLARPGRVPRSVAAHEAILRAIEAGDEDGASRAMREHLAIVADLGFPRPSP